MNFRPRRGDRLELNLIPMIDVLIVLLIFLVLTTTFRHESALKIRLPEAGSGSAAAAGKGIEVSIDAESRIAVNATMLPESSAPSLRQTIETLSEGRRDATIVIRADRNTPHQTVMTVLGVVGGLGFTRIAFATREPESKR